MREIERDRERKCVCVCVHERICGWVSVCVVYFDQFSGAARTRKLVELVFFSRYQPFFVLLKPFSVISRLKSTKNVRKLTKKLYLSTPQNWSKYTTYMCVCVQTFFVDNSRPRVNFTPT